MKTFLITLGGFLAFLALMAVGLLVGKKISGSCGGLGKIMGDSCMFCGKKDECEKNKKKSS